MTRWRRCPLIAITAGDPSGIGPEIAVKAAARSARGRRVPAGDLRTAHAPTSSRRFRRAGSSAGVGPRGVRRDRARRPTTRCAGRVDAIVTAPINKAAFAAAGLPWRGHTDLLAHLCGVPDVGDDVLVRPAARRARDRAHPAGRGAARADARAAARRRFGSRRASLPRFGVAVAAAGRRRPQSARGRARTARRAKTTTSMRAGGRRARAAEGIDVVGPFPADTLFVRAARGEFDVVDRRATTTRDWCR